jgi:hypothetical protein
MRPVHQFTANTKGREPWRVLWRQSSNRLPISVNHLQFDGPPANCRSFGRQILPPFASAFSNLRDDILSRAASRTACRFL